MTDLILLRNSEFMDALTAIILVFALGMLVFGIYRLVIFPII